MKRTFFSILALLLVASLLLTACQPAAEQQMEEEAAPAEEEAAPAEEAVEEPAMPEEITVVIGFTSSLTGKQEVSSKRQVNGFTLWLNQINEAGGITLGDGTIVKFDFKTYDDESNTERVQELYTRLISEDNADFLISPYSSGLTSAASIVAEQNGKVMITTGAADDDAYKTGNTCLFQLYTPASLRPRSPLFTRATSSRLAWSRVSSPISQPMISRLSLRKAMPQRPPTSAQS